MERRKASGIRENRCGVSGALARSGRKKFLTANILFDFSAVAFLEFLFWFYEKGLLARVGNENRFFAICYFYTFLLFVCLV